MATSKETDLGELLQIFTFTLEQWIALAQNVTVVIHYYTKKKLDKSEDVCLY